METTNWGLGVQGLGVVQGDVKLTLGSIGMWSSGFRIHG